MDYLVNGFWAAFALLANMDDATFSAITATLVSTSYAMAASLLMGLPMGFALGYCDFPGKKVLRLISDTLLAFPTVLIGLAGLCLHHLSRPAGRMGPALHPAGHGHRPDLAGPAHRGLVGGPGRGGP